MKNKKGFTLIELLAVIVILGLLMAIAIPSVTKYITESRKKTLTTTVGNYISALVNEVNDLSYTFTGQNTIYAVPIECIALERGGTNPFGYWYQANDAYFAYVLIQYDDVNSKYVYGFTFKDSAGYGLYPTIQGNINEKGKQIKTGYDLNKPQTGDLTSLTSLAKWQESGFKVDSNTNLHVLEATSENQIGDGFSTCTLCQKGDNYAQVEEKKEEEKEEAEKSKEPIIAVRNIQSFFWQYRSKIKTITFSNKIDIPSDIVESWDVSQVGNGQVMAYIKDSSTSGYYDLYIQGNGKIYANPDSSYLFSGFKYLTQINNLELLDTSKVINMSNMFSYCEDLLALDVSGFDTSKVTNMKNMFSYMYDIKSLDLSSFNTSSVTDMSYMFASISRLTSLNVSSFNTSKVTNMSNMFSYATTGITSLKKLDLSNFDTSNVTDMSGMFYSFAQYGGSGTINISSFDTSKVRNMSKMFKSARLTNFDVSHFDTSNVTDMSEMFGWSNVKSIDLSNFNTSNVTNMTRMFMSTDYLTELDLSSFDTSKVTTMYEMFAFSELQNVNVASFDTSNVTDMTRMFMDTKLTILDLRNFNTSKVTSMSYMFGCDTIHATSDKVSYFTDLNLSSFDTSSLKNASYMFYGTEYLNNINLSKADFSKVTSYTEIFGATKEGTNIIVKDETAKSWIQNKNPTANVVITT